ncbi:MBL fold metallo-hydrolase [Pseudoduganella plicata]|uniref:Ribonuclease Z n=1 Tax=Pseudoduganella plicata TaxID=321984 RepID=A0A4P7BA18_9BURK|nr:MBL fold metallo-hydrolase [Pseudoduganella plicata]QBQ34783.1 MBL fold metallo-hydrolase [Pseudoduganella plicata]GGY88464.1 ribonuclease Z [Pseudoduganella plicata]
MELQFLGTSSGTPTRTRNVAGLALRMEGGGWLLVDCGEGTQHRILHTSLSLHTLQAVLITHLHGDHCYGLPGLLASAGMANRTAPLMLVGPPALQSYLGGVMASTELRLPYELTFVAVETLVGRSLVPDLDISATPLSHRVPSWAYRFAERHVERRLDVAKLRAGAVPAGPLWGRLQQGEDVTLPDGRVLRPADYLLPARRPRAIVVAGDNDRPELLADAMRDADVLVHEATYTQAVLEKVGPGPQHSCARMVAAFAAAAGVPNLVLTHFSPRYRDAGTGPATLAEVADEARAQFAGPLFLAADLARYRLDRDGTLHPVSPP